MKELNVYSNEELLAELEERDADPNWPRTVNVTTYDVLEDVDMDDIANQLGFGIYNEEIKDEKLSMLDFPQEVRFTFSVNRSGTVSVVATNGFKISHDQFGVE